MRSGLRASISGRLVPASTLEETNVRRESRTPGEVEIRVGLHRGRRIRPLRSYAIQIHISLPGLAHLSEFWRSLASPSVRGMHSDSVCPGTAQERTCPLSPYSA